MIKTSYAGTRYEMSHNKLDTCGNTVPDRKIFKFENKTINESACVCFQNVIVEPHHPDGYYLYATMNATNFAVSTIIGSDFELDRIMSTIHDKLSKEFGGNFEFTLRSFSMTPSMNNEFVTIGTKFVKPETLDGSSQFVVEMEYDMHLFPDTSHESQPIKTLLPIYDKTMPRIIDTIIAHLMEAIFIASDEIHVLRNASVDRFIGLNVTDIICRELNLGSFGRELYAINQQIAAEIASTTNKN